jgi:hypothetical protein
MDWLILKARWRRQASPDAGPSLRSAIGEEPLEAVEIGRDVLV